MRRLALLAVTLSLAACKCGGGSVAGRFGDLVIVQAGPGEREQLLKEATVAVPPAFMGAEGEGAVPVRNVGQESVTVTAVARLEGDESLSLDGAVGLTVRAQDDGSLPVRFAPPQATSATLPQVTHRAKFAVTVSGVMLKIFYMFAARGHDESGEEA